MSLLDFYEEKPITKGKGRFGPFLKWNDLYVNIPRRFDPETITLEESLELIKIKVEKEAKPIYSSMARRKNFCGKWALGAIY